MALALSASFFKFEMFLRRLFGLAGAHAYSQQYWIARYRWGGHSGRGSQGRIAAAKSAFVTEFCRTHGVNSLVELGSGDGVCAAAIEVPSYLGLDISEAAIAAARARSNPGTHCFVNIAGLKSDGILDLVLRETGELPQASLSMDVILHLVEDEVFEDYMRALFSVASKYIVVFSSDADERGERHVRHRAWSQWFAEHYPVRLIRSDGEGLAAHFKVFEKA